jgi:O-Antigen ligase
MRAPPRDAAGAAILAATGALLLWSFFATETLMRIAWIGGFALATAGLAAAGAASGLLPRPVLTRAGVTACLAFAALVVWQGMSLLWSVLPDASWNYVNRSLVYGAFLVLGLFVGALLPSAPRRTAETLAALLGVLMAASLLGKVFPGIEDDYGRIARLRWPIGYWNGLAVLAVFALVLGIWLAVEHARVERRVCGTLLGYGAMVVAALTLSRGGIAVGVVAVVAWLAFDERRLESLAALAVAGAPAAVVSAIAFTLDGVTSDGEPRSARAHDGWIFLLVVLAGGAAVAGLTVLLGRRTPSPSAQRLGSRAAAVLSAAALAGLVAATVIGWSDFVNPKSTGAVPTGPVRVTSASSNHRWEWWGEAWHTFRDHPLDGTGAASFQLAHRLLRARPTPSVNEPHDFPLQMLAELGIVGFALLVPFVGGIAVNAGERFADPDRAPVAALTVCALAWGLDALVDIPYELLSVAAPLFVILGVLFARRGRQAVGGDVVWAVGLAGIAACAVLSLAAPALAEKRLEQGRYEEAHTLNPVSIDPLLRQAVDAEADHRDLRALRLYHEAVDVQPDNPEPWIQLGLFQLDTMHDACAAYQALNQAYTLDRHNTDVFYKDGPLDVARARVNAGACE